MIIRNKKEGFSLIELMIAIAFVAVVVVSIFRIGSFNSYVKKNNTERTKAIFYATQALEASRLITWGDLTVGNHGLSQVNNTWQLTGQADLLDNKYTRLIIVDNVYRANIDNGNVYGDIVASGNLDPDSKKITVTVSWLAYGGKLKQEVLETYTHRFKATRWTQTDWSGGAGQDIWSLPNKFFAQDDGIDVDMPGIVSLISGFIDWTNATTSYTFDTPGNFEDNDVFELDGYAYLVTKNNPSGSEFYILNVQDPANTSLESSLNIGDSVTSVVAQGDYVYLSTQVNNGEFKIINVSNKSNPVIIATYDLPTNTDAMDLVVKNEQAYIIQGSKMYSFSITDPAAPQLLDDVQVSDSMAALSLSANYIYVATLDASKELQIVNVTNPANLELAGQYNLSYSLKGTDVAARGSRAYISTENNGSGAEFYIFDITNPVAPVLLGQYEIGEMVHSFSLVGPYVLLGTNFLNEELVVLDVSNPTVMVQVAGFDLTGYVLGMSANCSIIYAATSGNAQEFFIISTNVINCEYAESGVLESSTFDTGSDQVSYNWISWSGDQPLGTTIRFQLASSNNINGPWVFVGPDGTSNTYYTNASAELINYNYHLNQRYLRYKLYLNSYNDLRVPILEEVNISYSTYP